MNFSFARPVVMLVIHDESILVTTAEFHASVPSRNQSSTAPESPDDCDDMRHEMECDPWITDVREEILIATRYWPKRLKGCRRIYDSFLATAGERVH